MVKPIDTDLKTGLKMDLRGDGLEVRKKRLKEACKDFEAVMTGYLFKAMQSNVLKAEEPEHGRAVFEEMLCEATAKEASRHDNIGIGDVLYRQLLPMVKVQDGDAEPALKKSTDSSDSITKEPSEVERKKS